MCLCFCLTSPQKISSSLRDKPKIITLQQFSNITSVYTLYMYFSIFRISFFKLFPLWNFSSPIFISFHCVILFIPLFLRILDIFRCHSLSPFVLCFFHELIYSYFMLIQSLCKKAQKTLTVVEKWTRQQQRRPRVNSFPTNSKRRLKCKMCDEWRRQQQRVRQESLNLVAFLHSPKKKLTEKICATTTDDIQLFTLFFFVYRFLWYNLCSIILLNWFRSVLKALFFNNSSRS